MKYTVQTGKITREINALNVTQALRKFLMSLKAKDFGIVVMVEYYDEATRGIASKMTPTEVALKRLGLESRFKKDLAKLRKAHSGTKRDVVSYEDDTDYSDNSHKDRSENE